MEQKCKKKNHGSRERHKHSRIDDWSIKIPSQMRVDKKCNYTTPIGENQCENSLHEALDKFILSTIGKSCKKNSMKKVLSLASISRLSQLWHIEYTNKLSFIINLLRIFSNKCSSREQKNFSVKNNSSSLSNQRNEDQNLENVQSQNSVNGDQKDKKKKKIKKSKKSNEILNKVEQGQCSSMHQGNLNDAYKAQNSHGQDDQQQKLLQRQITNIIQELQVQIIRVEKLYLKEILSVHQLPYLEAQAKLQQTNKQTHQHEKNTSNPSHVYPFQGNIDKLNANNSFAMEEMKTYKQDHMGINVQQSGNQNYTNHTQQFGGLNQNYAGSLLGFSYPMVGQGGMNPINQLSSFGNQMSGFTAIGTNYSSLTNSQPYLASSLLGHNPYGSAINLYEPNFLQYGMSPLDHSMAQKYQANSSKITNNKKSKIIIEKIENDQDVQSVDSNS